MTEETDPARAAERVSAALAASLDRLAPAQGAVGIGVSGGSDSAGLLLAAADWARARGRRLEAATVDHRLRPESGAEAAGVAALCASLCVPHAILPWDHDGAPPGNLAEAARDARRALLADWAAARGLSALLLAHTSDDQAETVLLRLARGAGADGLAGMAEASLLDDLPLLRPALGLGREDLRALCRARGVTWVEDPTNSDLTHDRPRARAALAALAPLGVSAAGLVRSAAVLAEQRDALEHGADRAAARLMRGGAAGEILLDRPGWAALPRDLRLRLLWRAIAAVAGGRRPRARALDPLEAALLGVAPLPPRSIAGALAGADAATITLLREPARAAPPVPAAPGAVWDGRWRLDGAPPEGATFGPLGTGGLGALSQAEAGGAWAPPPAWAAAPRAARLSAPGLMQGETLLCAPLACYDGGSPGLRITDLRAPR